eukprot:9708524-Alexandrium_andersonii.AAC.1
MARLSKHMSVVDAALYGGRLAQLVVCGVSGIGMSFNKLLEEGFGDFTTDPDMLCFAVLMCMYHAAAFDRR